MFYFINPHIEMRKDSGGDYGIHIIKEDCLMNIQHQYFRFRYIKIFLVIIINSLFFSLYTPAQDITIDPVTSFGGKASSIAIQGNYAYMGQGLSIRILDITNPQIAQDVAGMTMSDEVLDISIQGSTLYTITSDNTLSILDISNPVNPEIIGSCYVCTSHEGKIFLLNNIVFVNSCSYMDLIDVSNPSSPVVLNLPDIEVTSIFARGNYVYTTTENPDQLKILDITTPVNPVALDSIICTGTASDIFIQGDYAYVTVGNGLHVFNISNPQNITDVTYLTGNYNSVFIVGNNAYCTSFNTLYIIDISNPAQPNETGKIDIEQENWEDIIDLYIAPPYGYLIMNDTDIALHIVDLSNLSEVGNSDPSPFDVRQVFISDNHLYLTTYPQNLWIYQLDSLGIPLLQKRLELQGDPEQIFVEGDILTMTLWGSEVYFYDISNLDNIDHIGTYNPFPRDHTAIFKQDSLLFLLNRHYGGGDGWLEIINIKDPSKPNKLGEYKIPGEGRDVFVEDGLAYIAYHAGEKENGFLILDVSDPALPQQLGSAPVAAKSMSIRALDGIVVAGGNQGDGTTTWWLESFNTTILSSPSKVAEVNGEGTIWGIEIINNLIFAGINGGSMHIYSILFDELGKCPSPATTGMTITQPDASGNGYVYTSEGQGSSDSRYKSGEKGIVIQEYKTGKPAGKCCLQTFVLPADAQADGCKVEPVYAGANCNSPIQVTAIPVTPWNFERWGTGGKVNPTNIILNKRCNNLTGIFVKPVIEITDNDYVQTYCPCDTVRKYIAAFPFTLTVNDAADWEVNGITFQAIGTGDDFTDIEHVKLYRVHNGGETLKDTGYFNKDNGTVSLGVFERINKNESKKFKLVYQFFSHCKDTIACSNPMKTYQVQYKGEWINGYPILPAYPNYLKKPVSIQKDKELILSCISNVNTGESFTKIQDAIYDEETKDGHEIRVCPGKYIENVVVNKSLTIRSTGTYKNTIIKSPVRDKDVFEIYTNDVEIKNLTIKGGRNGVNINPSSIGVLSNIGIYSCLVTENKRGINACKVSELYLWSETEVSLSSDEGIKLERCHKSFMDHCNILSNDSTGVVIVNSDSIIIRYSKIGANSSHGLYLNQVCDSEVLSNTVSDNMKCGIKIEHLYIKDKSTNLIFRNKVNSNQGKGIHIVNSSNTTLEKNTVNNNFLSNINEKDGVIFLFDYDDAGGIRLNGDKYIVKENSIYSNFGYGLKLYYSKENIVERNSVYSNLNDGIQCYRCMKTRIAGNAVYDNDPELATGIDLASSDDNIINKNLIKRNRGGIHLYHSQRNSVKNNIVEKNGVVALGAYIGFGIAVRKANSNFIEYNQANKNGNGIFVDSSYAILIKGNHVWYNSLKGIELTDSKCLISGNSVWFNYNFGILNKNAHTGIHVDNSIVDIIGNTIANDSTDGIFFENGATGLVCQNNIFDNIGSGLVNSDPGITILAKDNWWGDASGPGGAGSGSGDEVSGNVVYSDWRVQSVSLIMTISKDTLFIPIGGADSVECYFQNWQNPDDTLDVHISTDSLDWIFGTTDLALIFEDSMGVAMSINIEVPDNVSQGAITQMKITAQSQTDPAATGVDSFLAIAYQQILAGIDLYPDTTQLTPGESQLFEAEGTDSYGNFMEVAAKWDAAGGTIDSTGFFTAGTEYGTFFVIAEDIFSKISDSSIVHIIPPTEVEDINLNLIPEKFVLYQNYPNPFNPKTTIRYDVKERIHVVLKVYDLIGREIIILADKEYQPGRYNITFNANHFPTGIYFYRIRMGDFCDTKKMVLIK
jgi:parallel beta-helix repeat protein